MWITIEKALVKWVPNFIPHSQLTVNTLRPRQNGRHFADDIFKCIFLNENVWIPIKISLKFVPHGPINNIPALVWIMAWRRPGDKPLSGPMMVRLPTHNASLGLNELNVTAAQLYSRKYCTLQLMVPDPPPCVSNAAAEHAASTLWENYGSMERSPWSLF